MSDPITPALAHRVLDALEQSPHIGPDGSLSALFIIRDAVKAWEAESDREEEAEFYAKVYHRTGVVSLPFWRSGIRFLPTSRRTTSGPCVSSWTALRLRAG